VHWLSRWPQAAAPRIPRRGWNRRFALAYETFEAQRPRAGSLARRFGLALALLGALSSVSAAPAAPPLTTQEPLSDTVWQRMAGRSWHAKAGCPNRADLVLLRVPYHDFDGRERIGQMIVGKAVAATVGKIFDEIYRTDFRIFSIRPVDDFEGDDQASMAANNSSAFNCRAMTGGTGLSAHAQGLAIDINPAQNPYVKGAKTEPASATALDQPAERAAAKDIGLIRPDGPVVAIFGKHGWKWGGTWTSLKDYQHFSSTGR